MNEIEIKKNFESTTYRRGYQDGDIHLVNKLIDVNDGEIYISLLMINNKFDRFKRKLPPTKIIGFDHDYNFITEKNKLIKDGYLFIISSSYEKCVYEYNKQIDDIGMIYENKIKNMKEKYNNILKTKINIRKKKFKTILN